MKFLKYLLYFLIFLIVAGFIAIKILSEKKPTGESGPQAELLADQILESLNKNAFDTIPYIQWEFFRPGQKYLWNKKENKAIIEFDDVKVVMDLDNMNAECYKAGQLLTGKNHEEAKAKAWSNWCNDSFWLIAPFKIKDKGTQRKLVKKDNKTHLLVEYISGGVTPGDSYLWILDENKKPTGWKMWTSILPMKGLYTSWHNWNNYQGAFLASGHNFFGKEVTLKNIKTGNHYSEFGFDKNPFENK